MFTSALRPFLVSLPILMVLPVASQTQAAAQEKGKTFEVVSIRQNVSQEPRVGRPDYNPELDGFHVMRVPMRLVLMTAYAPKGSVGALFVNNIENLPEWAQDRYYDIDARVADGDRVAWQDPKNQPAMLQAMLQAMLADRFRLVVHRETKEVPVYALVVAKSGAKLMETKPDEPRPSGLGLPGGGVMVLTRGQDGNNTAHLYNFSMGLLASVLSDKAERPIVDKTGLSGHYSFDIREPAKMSAPSTDSNGPHDEPMPAMADALKAVGLKLESAKEPVEKLVIDRMEKPTDN